MKQGFVLNVVYKRPCCNKVGDKTPQIQAINQSKNKHHVLKQRQLYLIFGIKMYNSKHPFIQKNRHFR